MKKTIISSILAVIFAFSLSVNAFAYNATTATSTTPWYGVCSGDGVRIRQSPSITGTELGTLGINQPIEVISTDTEYWVKVKYNESGNVGYVSSTFLYNFYSSYGWVIRAYGVDMMTTKGGTTPITHVSYGRYMPYNTMSTYGSYYWAHCVCGRTAGWVNTYNSGDFKYTD